MNGQTDIFMALNPAGGEWGYTPPDPDELVPDVTMVLSEPGRPHVWIIGKDQVSDGACWCGEVHRP